MGCTFSGSVSRGMRLLLLGLLLVPLAFAFDCSSFDESREVCEELVVVDEQLVASLIVPPSSESFHERVQEYNEKILVDSPPFGTFLFSEGVIKDAWVDILSIEPSIIFNDSLLISSSGVIRSGFGHRIELPPVEEYSVGESNVCLVEHTLIDERAELSVLANDAFIGTEPVASFEVNRDVIFSTEYTVNAVVRRDEYRWERDCCRFFRNRCVKWCYDCELSTQRTYTDTLLVYDYHSTVFWSEDVPVSFAVRGVDRGYSGVLNHTTYSNVDVYVGNSSITENSLVFSANFTKKPHNFLQLRASFLNDTSFQNVLRSEGTYYFANNNSCIISYNSFFESSNKTCTVDASVQDAEEFTSYKSVSDWTYLFRLGVLFFVLFVIYRSLKHSWGKTVPFLIGFFFVLPSVSAAEDCGLTNLASCIPEKFFSFILDLLNAPLTPLLDAIRSLLGGAPNIQLFGSVWAVIVYALSLFYGLLFVYAGFQFLFSGHDVIRREQAKEWLKNTVMLIVFVQASYYLYGLFVDIGSILTSAVLNMVDPNFFLLSADNIINIGLEFLFVLVYAVVLLLTLLLLTIRYLIVSLGVLFVPIGIFCWFIPPLKSYGKLILNILGVNIFVSFVAAIVVLACSQLITLPVFENMKILVMIACFLIIDLLFLLLAWHVVSKAAFSDGANNLAQAAKFIGKVF